MIKAIIFDMDGVMFDTESLWVTYGKSLAKELGYDVPEELFISTVGIGNAETKAIFDKNLNYSFPIIEFRNLYHKKINEMVLKGKIKEKYGLKELLVYLKNNKYKIAIGSSNIRKQINLYLKSAGISPDFFDIIISSDDVSNGKPSPEIYNKVVSYLNEKRENVLILEDSLYGVVAGYKSGCRVIFIPDVISLPKNIENLAYKKVSSLMDVIDILKNK